MSKLNLDRDKISSCREIARRIAERVYQSNSKITTDSIERASLRLLGIEDSYNGMPVVNLILESIPESERGKGVCYWFGRGLATQRSSPIALALRVAGGKVKLTDMPEASEGEIRQALNPLLRKGLDRLHNSALRKNDMERRWPSRSRPLKYVSVGTGDIVQDTIQATAAAKVGADCVNIVRSSGQSLMEYVPHGETSEGNEGTYVTQQNLRTMRRILDNISKEEERYIRLVTTASGLCMPEIAVLASFENADYLLSDALYGILFRDIHAKRAFADQEFARLVLAHSGVIINTGEDQYLAFAESYRVFHQALASLFLNEQFSFLSRLSEWQMGFSHAFEIDPDMEDGFLYEVAQAQMVRECFPKAPIKYKPPTRHKTGDIFYSHLMDGLFTVVGAMTHQDIQELGTATEAIHHPLMMDRHWALKAANYVSSNTRSLGDEIQWSANGKVVRRARSVLDAAYKLLQKIEKTGGLLRAISNGAFANVSRQVDQGMGSDGIIKKEADYLNPVLEALQKEEGVQFSIAPASHRRYASYRSVRAERPSRPEKGARSERGSSRQGRSRQDATRNSSRRRGGRYKDTRSRSRDERSSSRDDVSVEEPITNEEVIPTSSEEVSEIPIDIGEEISSEETPQVYDIEEDVDVSIDDMEQAEDISPSKEEGESTELDEAVTDSDEEEEAKS
jgi:beta-lysine 5,6-aminomutase alpha subunit